MPLFSTTTAVRSGFSALRNNPLRTFLSALGVVIGIGAMISVLALSDGVEASIRKQLAADGRVLSLRVEPRTTQLVDGLPMPRLGFPFFGGMDADELNYTLKQSGFADLVVNGPAFVSVAPGAKERAVLLRGVRRVPATIADRGVAAGRLFTEAEGRSGAHVLVLGDALAATLAQTVADSTAGPVITSARLADRGRDGASVPQRPQPTAAACRALVGRNVTIGGKPWQIVGLLAPADDTPSACSGTTPTATMRGPAQMAQMALAPSRAVLEAAIVTPGRPMAPSLIVTAARVEELPAVRRTTEQWLEGRFGKPVAGAPGWKDQVDLVSYEKESESIRQGMLMFRLLMSAITGISLVVGGVGIMNVLLASVTERTREIGISKAVGARRRDVLAQYLAESVAIAAMGAVLGTALGYGVAQIVAAVMRRQATIPVHAGFSVSTLLVAVGAPLIVGLCFGMYPAMRASRLSPIDAIRHE